MNVLLTGANGFIGHHILDCLLGHGYNVTIVVRSNEKGEQVLQKCTGEPRKRLSVAIVQDFTLPGAFNNCFWTTQKYNAVVHTASPYHFNASDAKKELLDPSIIGTKELLKSIHSYGQSVKRVVLTSSFAAILDSYKPNEIPQHTYSERDWNPLIMEDALKNARSTYRASKLFAERAAWEFIEKEMPAFSLTTINPTFVFGPVTQPLSGIDQLNTSSMRIYDFIAGNYKDKIPDTGISFFLWIDVRDLALAHVRAITTDTAKNQRYLLTAGYFNNRRISEIIRRKFPEYIDVLPPRNDAGGWYPSKGVYGYDNSKATDDFGLQYRSLEESVTDTVLSIQGLLLP